MDQSNVFQPGPTFKWNPAAGGWEESVHVPGPGVLAFHSPESKSLVLSNGIVVRHPGSATLIIKPTPAGKAALADRVSIPIPLTLTFTPDRGLVASKTITAVLRRGA